MQPPGSRRNTLSSVLPPTPDDRNDEDDLLPDLRTFIDGDPKPTFIVPINLLAALPFRILQWNNAFEDAVLNDIILEEKVAARHYRSWTQAVANWRESFEFAGWVWAAFKIQGRWKCIRAINRSEDAPKDMVTRTQSHSVHPLKRMEEVEMSDARLASLYKMMEMSDVGTFEYAPEGTLLRANESWYRLSLHPRASETHQDFSFMDLVYPADGPLVLSQWNKLCQGIPVTFEMRWKGASYNDAEPGDGIEDAQWVLSACVPIMDDQGQIASIAGNTIDINAQKRVQAQALQRAEALELARATERKFSQFALLAPIAIYALDGDGKMTYCNNRFFELTGHAQVEDYASIDWDKNIVYPDDLHVVADLWKTLLDDKQPSDAHIRLKKTWNLGDGVLRQTWVESQASPEFDAEGNVVSIFGTLSDISRFKWAEEIQRTRIEEALEAKRKQENFIDMTSHEMRNPLSAVVQCADSTLDSIRTVTTVMKQAHELDGNVRKRLDDELRASIDSLTTIISCSLHQKRVVDDILTLSKMDSNLMTISPVRTDPAAIVSDAVHMFELECQKDKISLTYTEDPSLRALGALYVQMDPSRALQVLINLITNAIKSTRDRPTREIEVTLGAALERPDERGHDLTFAPVTTAVDSSLNNEDWGQGRTVYIWVKCRDTGCGLSLNEQGNLFTRFSQATPRTHIRYGGSGLGLWISKRLTELQGGAIGVSSKPEKGATFGFFVATRLAAPPTPLRVDETKDSYLDKSRSKSIDAGKAGKLGYSVLIVEDNLVNQKVLSQQLRKAGCTVHVANHGQEALSFLQKTTFWSSTAKGSGETDVCPSDLDIVLMDVEMPVMDGLTCTRKIRELQDAGEIAGHVPIISVSANARSEQIAQAKQAGVDDSIAKPFRIPELIPKIEALLRGEEPALAITTGTGLA